jgi:hypothetical protein
VLDPSEALNEQAMYAIYTGEHPRRIVIASIVANPFPKSADSNPW